jgi:hypothetical protein
MNTMLLLYVFMHCISAFKAAGGLWTKGKCSFQCCWTAGLHLRSETCEAGLNVGLLALGCLRQLALYCHLDSIGRTYKQHRVDLGEPRDSA